MSDWKNVQYKDGKKRTSSGGGEGGSSTLAGLDDVSFTNLQNGQVPKYNSTTQKWENANESGGSGHTYSTTEQVVGTWYNGKTIYEITYEFSSAISLSSSSWAQPSPKIDSSNIDDVIMAFGVASDGTGYTYLGADPTRDSHAHLGFKAVTGSITRAVVQYTKTTD